MSNTCLVLGNGESLNDMPKTLLDKYPSFGCNRIDLAGIEPTYFVCIDHRTLPEVYQNAKKAKKAFLGGVCRPQGLAIYELENAEVILSDKKSFYKERSFSGGTVLYPMLKQAFYMFDNVLLFGVDFDPDWKHFTEDYPAHRNLDRKIDEMLDHMTYASKVYKKAGKRIINFSKPSVLDNIFERDDLENWI